MECHDRPCHATANDRIHTVATAPLHFTRTMYPFYPKGPMPDVSKAEEDRRRRQGSASMSRNTKIALGVVAVVVVTAIVWSATRDPELGPEATGDFQQTFQAFGLQGDAMLGNASANVAVVGFEAPTCSACRYFHGAVLPELKAEYFDTGRAAFYYSQYRISPVDFDIGIMQECALKYTGNDGFWDYTDRIYLELGTYPSSTAARAKLQEFATAWEAPDVLTCADEKETGALVNSDWNVGEAWSVTGTPTFYVFNDQEVVKVGAGDIARTLEALGA